MRFESYLVANPEDRFSRDWAHLHLIQENLCTVVPHYNDHLYNGNFDFRRNFFGNGSFLMKIYYIIMEFALFDTDRVSRQGNAFFFFTHFLSIKTTGKKHPINCLLLKFSTCHKLLPSLSQMIDR